MDIPLVLFMFLLMRTVYGIRINFTSCHSPEWSCVNNTPSEIIYTCSAVRSNDFIIHLKDFYTDHILSVVVQNCRDIRVVLDCPTLQKPSKLQQFKVKDCDRLEFITLSINSLIQTPPEVIIENVRDIVSLPKKIFKSPTTITEQKCLGSTMLRKIRIANSKINLFNTKAIYNVTGIKIIEFENVTITDVHTQAIEAYMGYENTQFTIVNSNIEKLNFKGITIQCSTAKMTHNTFGDIITNGINITSDSFEFTSNTVVEINSNGLITNSVNTEFSNNIIGLLKSNAMASVKCSKKKSHKKQFNFTRNKIEKVEPYSLIFDYISCKLATSQVIYRENAIDCNCQNIAFLNSQAGNKELNDVILNVAHNNTCLVAPCVLPVEVVKLLIENDMCHLNLDPQVMCMYYGDKHSSSNRNDVTTDEEVTEPAPMFYLIRQANSLSGDTGAAMTAIDKDDLLKDSHQNMTNRTTIKVVFDSSRDFVETLRSTGTSKRSSTETSKTPPRDEYVNRCVGGQCRNTAAYDKQKALDFYKYVYAQLRTPRQNNKNGI